MHILVTYASRHNATAQIAEVIGSVLRKPDDETYMTTADVRAVEDVDEVTDYDGVVLGSAIYNDRWLPAARQFAQDNVDALRTRPVWLFSCGPVGEPLGPKADVPDLAEITEELGVRGATTFPGRLRAAELGLLERATVRLINAPEGDYRDWDAIRAWAEVVHEALVASTTSGLVEGPVGTFGPANGVV
jgi:menaquinone-dependent protoporphyrinogen oxidase